MPIVAQAMQCIFITGNTASYANGVFIMSLKKDVIVQMVAQGLISEDAAAVLANAMRQEPIDNNYGIDLKDLTVIRVTENGKGFKETKSELTALLDTKIVEARKSWEQLREHQKQLTKFRKADMA